MWDSRCQQLPRMITLCHVILTCLEHEVFECGKWCVATAKVPSAPIGFILSKRQCQWCLEFEMVQNFVSNSFRSLNHALFILHYGHILQFLYSSEKIGHSYAGCRARVCFGNRSLSSQCFLIVIEY